MVTVLRGFGLLNVLDCWRAGPKLLVCQGHLGAVETRVHYDEALDLIFEGRVLRKLFELFQ